MSSALASHRSEIARLCTRFGVARLEAFGSAASGEFRPGCSDFDFLVEVDEQASGSRAARLVQFADALEALLGASVDIVSPRYIRNPYFAAEVARTRVPVYDRSASQTTVCRDFSDASVHDDLPAMQLEFEAWLTQVTGTSGGHIGL